MDCTLNDLRSKEVINLYNGRRMGYVSDVELDVADARLLSVTVPGERGLFSRAPGIRIPWTCIRHIGEDIIIVELREDGEN